MSEESFSNSRRNFLSKRLKSNVAEKLDNSLEEIKSTENVNEYTEKKSIINFKQKISVGVYTKILKPYPSISGAIEK